ncbi:hypothetical protein ACFRCI_43045 [Streptomyces sp. NPDC056638]|uniref:hypothetical protein n=1 Tax=Streptomyces sp. NPDC056638 TaxID=3345887 RepID=UPI0036CB93CE
MAPIPFPRSGGLTVHDRNRRGRGVKELNVHTLTHEELAALRQGDVRLLDSDIA